jgi:hypothetical protein
LPLWYLLIASLVSSDCLFGIQSEDTKEAIRRYQRGNQKIPKRQSEDIKEAIRRYQRGIQKIPKRQSEDTKEAFTASDCLFGIF